MQLFPQSNAVVLSHLIPPYEAGHLDALAGSSTVESRGNARATVAAAGVDQLIVVDPR